jgi:uroporphyrinogen-III synthase
VTNTASDGQPARQLPSAWTLGPRTRQALANWGSTSQTPEQSNAAALLAELDKSYGSLLGKRVLLPRALEGLSVLPDGLAQRGAQVSIASLYETRPVGSKPVWPKEAIDWVALASPSAATGFSNHFKVPAGVRVACIGPSTEQRALKHGILVDVVASKHTWQGIVEALDGIA